jgi:hypothetical protein
MENEFIQKTMQICTYQLKADTKTSYYWKGGSQILPNRISVKDDLFSPIKKSSNTLHPTIGEFKAQFTHKEQSQSSLMRNKPYQVHTKIRRNPDHPQFIGYGTCGISDSEGKITDIGDLMIFYSNDSWQTITIFYFVGMATPEHIDEAFKFAASII